MKRKILLSSVLIIIAIVAFYTINSGQKVDAVAVRIGNLSESIEETGYIESSEEYEVQALETGRILSISTDRGQQVRSGQVLFTMQSIDMDVELASLNERLAATQTELDSAKIDYQTNILSLNQARADLIRKKKLLDAGGITQIEYENAVNEVEKLQSTLTSLQNVLNGFQQQLDSIEVQHRELEIKSQQLIVNSPINGVLMLLNVKAGQLVSQGTVLAKVGTAGGFAVKTNILCDDMENVKLGQSVEISSVVLSKPLNGKITEIYPQAHEEVSSLGVAQRRVSVIAALGKSEYLKPGYEVQVRIKTAEKKGTLVLPRESVLSEDEAQGEVNRIIGGKVVKQKVKIGLKNQKYVEIKSGLKNGDIVVRDASLQIDAGSRVKITSSK